MKNNILHIFFLALAALLCLCSCGLEEPIDTPQNSDGYVEFVARHTSYNKLDVATKADEPDPIEDVAYNAFLLIFDEYGQLILKKQVIPSSDATTTTTPSATIPIDKGLSTVTACYLINVPHDFADGITGLTMPLSATEEYRQANYNKYIDTAVLEDITYKQGTPLGIPLIDVDDDASTPAVECLPMFGMAEVNMHDASRTKQIPIKRLFAKVSVDLSLNVAGIIPNVNILRSTFFELSNYQICNLPKMVKLLEDASSQSQWRSDPNSFSSLGSGVDVVGKAYTSREETNIKFHFYVPEYYLSAKKDADENPKNKPINFPDNTHPTYLKLTGIYKYYSVSETGLQYKIYLGADTHSDFSLARNTHYKNTLQIKGISNNEKGEGENLDWRVTTEVVNNPVSATGMSANCYIIANAGQNYEFPAIKGAYNNLSNAVLCNNQTAKRLEVVANDNSNNIELTNLAYDPDMNIFSFYVNKIANGNVIIALKNEDGSTEWSWHLWCAPGSRADILGIGALDNQPYPSGSEMMDRNLGATRANGTGLYYKYGDKKPYISDDYKGGGTNGTTTWLNLDSNNNEIKAIYDPCPPGYRVPQQEVWASEKQNNMVFATGSFTYTPAISLNNVTLDPVYYQYSGYRNGSSVVTSIVAPDVFDASTIFTKTDRQYIGDYSDPVDVTNALQRRTKVNTDYKYTNFRYQANETKTFGAVFSNDGDLLFYEYANLTLSSQTSISIVSCICTETQTVETQERTLWKTVLGNKIWNTWKDKGSTTTTNTYILYKHDDFDNPVWLGELFTLESARNLASGDYGFKSLDDEDSRFDPEYGYQIRCVAEQKQM